MAVVSGNVLVTRSMKFRVVIPSRLASTRLPRKPLAMIAGRSLVAHVVERALESQAHAVLVAADADEILDAVDATATRVATLLTPAELASGTDRIAYAAAQLGWADDEIVVNLQGDEPLVPGALLDRLAAVLADAAHLEMATVATPIRDTAELADPNKVKVVRAANDDALYFSRAPIPFDRDAAAEGRAADVTLALRHLGLYAYRVGFLKRMAAAPVAPLEALEKLEQLRALHLGARIRVLEIADALPPGVDTAEDLQRVRDVLEGGASEGRPASPPT